MTVWFCGDPHGKVDYIYEAVAQGRPDAIVILGDIECDLPFDKLFSPIMKTCDVWYIHGNHDVDTAAYWRNLSSSQKSLHARTQHVCDLVIGGLGGVFDAEVWHPSLGSGNPSSQNHEEYANKVKGRKVHPRFIERQIEVSRSYIYPDDYFSLAMERADILVTHEAPACHKLGFIEIDELADNLGARKIFHGHHHETYITANVYGVGFRSIVDEMGRVIC